MSESTAAQRDETARAVSAVMSAADRAAQLLGIEAGEIADGQATMTMLVRPDMANSQGNCHGGILFSLADTAFGHACNGSDDATVIAQASTEFIRPAPIGARLTARAVRQHQGRLLGTYDVEIRDDQQRLIVLMRGRSCRVGGRVTGPAG